MFIVINTTGTLQTPINHNFAKRSLNRRLRATTTLERDGFKTSAGAIAFAKMLSAKYNCAFLVAEIKGTANATTPAPVVAYEASEIGDVSIPVGGAVSEDDDDE